MFKQGPVSFADRCPLGVRKLGEDMDEDEGSGSNMRKAVPAVEGFPTGEVTLSRAQSWDGNRWGPRSMSLGPAPFPWLLWDWPCCHTFLSVTKIYPGALQGGWGEPAESPTPSGLLDDFLLGDGWWGDHRGRFDNGGDGSWQELVGLRS